MLWRIVARPSQSGKSLPGSCYAIGAGPYAAASASESPMADDVRPSITPATLRDIGFFGGSRRPASRCSRANFQASARSLARLVVREGDTSMRCSSSSRANSKSSSKRSMEAAFAWRSGPGDWFGEMAILNVHPRSASVRALAPSLLLSMGAEQVERLLYRRDVKDYALVLMNISRELGRRLRVADGILAQFFVSMHEQYNRATPKS